MKIKYFLIVVELVVIAASIFTVLGRVNSISAKAQPETNVSRPLFLNEPAVEMQSGEIQSSDNNSPDFRPHSAPVLMQHVASECISEENIQPRRWSGCLE